MEELAGASFNSCLLNLYRDGGDHMGWHSDNEYSYYGRQPTIGGCFSCRLVLWFLYQPLPSCSRKTGR